MNPAAMNEGTEERLRAEIEDLKRRLEASHQGTAGHHAGPSGHRRRPSATALWILGLLMVGALVAAFFLGYLPQSSRQTALAKEAQESGAADPLVNVANVERSPGKSELVLPGSIQAVTEAPVLARASGYIKKRYADIGDHVREGDLLAEIEAPELDQQVRQAKAGLDQASSALEQATANLQQGKTNAEMARITNERWGSLVQKGAVARQDADTYRAQYDAQRANVDALEKAVNAARSNVAVAEANLGRLTEMQGYLKVRAPFTGVITLRNVDTGALVNDANTLMFRIAQIERLRTYVNVPQADSTGIHVGQAATLKIPDLPSKSFTGVVTRTANSLDPSTRTLLTEVQVPNETGQLLPGMYAEVNFTTPRAEPPLVIRGDTLVVRSEGPQVAVVGPDNRVHYQLVQLGRDYGDRVEVLAGLEQGQRLVINPGDAIREKTRVKPRPLGKDAAQ